MSDEHHYDIGNTNFICGFVMLSLKRTVHLHERERALVSRVARSTLALAFLSPRLDHTTQSHRMADFFNLKARQQAAAQASSSKVPSTKQQPDRLQPWVEK